MILIKIINKNKMFGVFVKQINKNEQFFNKKKSPQSPKLKKQIEKKNNFKFLISSFIYSDYNNNQKYS